jgi:carboxypeptidase family protein
VEAGAAGRSSFSTMQSVVALVAGLSSIAGAAYSAIGMLHGGPVPGEIVAVVRDASTAKPVAGAVVEVLTPESALVTTAVQGDDGLARRSVPPGAYHVRVTHPDFVEAVRDVQVASATTAEMRIALEHRPRPTVRGEHGSHARGSVVDDAADASASRSATPSGSSSRQHGGRTSLHDRRRF